MLKLFAKELKLNVPWGLYLFSLLVLVMLSPNYPAIVGVGYVVMLIFRYFQYVQVNRSQEFSMLLPVKRSDVAKSMVLVVVFMQIITLILAGICTFICKFVYPSGNIVGIDSNFTFLGIACGCMGAFNFVFFPRYFKTGEKFGLPIVCGLIAFLLFYGICEITIQVFPTLTIALDSYNADFIWARIVAFLVGIVLYCVSTFVATKISIKRFERVNL